MQFYRMFFFDRAGHIEHSHEFEAEDDARAIRIADGWREGRRVELWERNKLVKRWD